MLNELQIEDVLAQNGMLSNYFDLYEERVEQLELSKKILNSYINNNHLIIEAGTGVGKSFGYLVPAILNAKHNNEKTVVATSTITLQKQLFDKDIPNLLSAMKENLKYALVMGRGNYLCLKRYNESIYSNSIFLTDPTSFEAKLREFVLTTEDGILDSFLFKSDSFNRVDIASDHELCLGQKCKHFNECFYYKSKRRSEEADIIVTNHHLLFLDARLRYDSDETYDDSYLLPSFSRLIIDESHNIDKNATALFSSTFSLSEFLFEYRKLKGVKYTERGVDLLSLLYEKSNAKGELVKEIESSVEELSSLVNQLNSTFTLSLKQNEVRVTEDIYQIFINKYEPLLLSLTQAFDTLSFKLDKLLSSTKLSDEESFIKDNISSITNHFYSFSSILKKFLNIDFKANEVFYIKRERNGSREVVSFCISPLSVSDMLSEIIFSQLKTVVTLSATLKVDSDFEFFKKQVGLTSSNLETYCYSSPFNFKSNLLLLLDSGRVKYNPTNDQEYIEHITPKIVDAICASDGGALVLFTSYMMMFNCYERVKEKLKKYNILIQDGKTSRSRLLKEFKEDQDSILFATQSFWEGVDIRGSSLRLLILTKLPYPQVNDPIFKARCEKLEEEGESSFIKLSMPEMIMKLKQGLGRLIRSKTDRGVALILDGRINKFREHILKQLPECNIPEEYEDESLSRMIENFLY